MNKFLLTTEDLNELNDVIGDIPMKYAAIYQKIVEVLQKGLKNGQGESDSDD